MVLLSVKTFMVLGYPIFVLAAGSAALLGSVIVKAVRG